MKDKVVFITGGTSGFGKATAERFAQEGARVIIAARSQDALDAVSAAVGCDALRMDVMDYDAWLQSRAYILERYGRLDVLINNAGGGIAIKPAAEQTKDEIDRAVALNLNSVLYACSVFAPVFMEQRTGTIINLSSVCARECWPTWGVYGAAKAGVLNFSKSLYLELRPYGVRVTTLIPAASRTNFNPAAGLAAADYDLAPSDIAETALYICRLPQHAVVEDVTVWGMDQDVNPL